MEEALVARLLADSGVSTLVEKIVWGVRPQDSGLPAVVLSYVDPGRSYTFKGAADLQGSLIQFDIWALKFGAALAVFRALVAEMEEPLTIGGIRFDMAFLRREATGSEDVPGVGTVHRFSADFLIWWKPN